MRWRGGHQARKRHLAPGQHRWPPAFAAGWWPEPTKAWSPAPPALPNWYERSPAVRAMVSLGGQRRYRHLSPPAKTAEDPVPSTPQTVPAMDLIVAAQRDPAAFAAIYERYVDGIVGYCLNRLQTSADAEDAASVVFARAFQALPRFRPQPDRPDSGVRSWLFTIAHNAIVSRYRDHRPTAPLTAADLLPDPALSPEDHAITSERERRLRVAVARLADDQRQVVELRLAGLTGPEIATVIGRSHGAIKMLQLRAIDRLRELLGDRLADADPAEVCHDAP